VSAELVTGEAFDDLFRQFQHSARKFECRRSYGVPEEDEPFQLFLAGKDPGLDWFRPWLDLMAAQHAAGKLIQRVRVIDEPPSDYLRFELWGTAHNIAAGEDIRYLPRAVADTLSLPQLDFWLFDARTLAVLNFDDDGRPLGARMVDDPSAVVTYAAAFDAAWHHAVPFADYQRHTPGV
jgi:hypothetical protein